MNLKLRSSHSGWLCPFPTCHVFACGILQSCASSPANRDKTKLVCVVRSIDEKFDQSDTSDLLL